MKRQPIIISTQYLSKTDFCSRWKVSPHKLQDLINQGLLGGIQISNILYIDVSKASVIRAALSYKHTNRAFYSHSNNAVMTKRKFQNEEEEKYELAYLESQEE